MGLIKEFKEFAMRGNVMDMAVGVIIGGAFGKIITSLVEDMIMPIVGMFTGSGMEHLTKKFGEGDTAAILKYGNFCQTIVNFLIIAFAIFMMIKIMNSAQAAAGLAAEEEAPAAPPEDIQLLREIRDSLNK